MKTYSEKLKDPRWQKKRLEILNRDEFACQKCGDTETTLHVHHKKYNSGEPWDIGNDHLTTLCEFCHSIIEAYYKNTFDSIDIMRFGDSSMQIRVVMSGKGAHLIEITDGILKSNLVFKKTSGSLDKLISGLTQYRGGRNG